MQPIYPAWKAKKVGQIGTIWDILGQNAPRYEILHTVCFQLLESITFNQRPLAPPRNRQKLPKKSPNLAPKPLAAGRDCPTTPAAATSMGPPWGQLGAGEASTGGDHGPGRQTSPAEAEPGQGVILFAELRLTRRSRNQTSPKLKSWGSSQSASKGPWILAAAHSAKNILPETCGTQMERYYDSPVTKRRSPRLECNARRIALPISAGSART